MNHKKLLKFFAAAVVLCLALTGQVFAASDTGVSVTGKITSSLPGVGCTVQLVQSGTVKYSTVIYSNAGHAAQEFTIPGVASGIYDLVITKPGHLSYTVKDIVVGDSDIDLTSSSNEQISDITLVAGDINGDGCIDLQDVTIITSTANYGKKPVVTIYEGASTLDDFIIEATETGITIIGVKDKTKTKYIVPKNVTSISQGAFSGCTNLESITLPFVGETRDGTENTHFGYIFGASAYASNNSFVPASLKTVAVTDATSIGECAFNHCTRLTSITLPEGVTSIGDYAFTGCSSLTSITIPNSVTSIGEDAFAYCRSLKNVAIPDGVTSIGVHAFLDCLSLTSVTIPEGVTSIGNLAFRGCSGLSSITIPDSVTSIGNQAFYACSNLTSITYGGTKAQWATISKGTDWNWGTGDYTITYEDLTGLDDFYYDITETGITITDVKVKTRTEYIIPDCVTSIGPYAFYGCMRVASVTISDSVTSIGDHAFYNCSSLTSVMIGNGVTSIGAYAFDGCRSLENIKIPDSVTIIGDHAFASCGLTSVTIPGSVTSIGEDAFWLCTSLTSVTIGKGITSIGNRVFVECTSLMSVTIPNSVTSIGGSAFAYCDSLTSITIPDSVTNIGPGAFYGCSSLTSITIPDSVTIIYPNAFRNCPSLTSIKYGGTESQWEAITKGADWDYGTGNYTITYNYTGGDTGASGSGFTTQPVVSYTDGMYTIRYAAPANSTLYYYLTNYYVAPTANAFIGNYNAATGSTITIKTGGMLAANGTTQTAQTVLSTTLGASYDYMVLMLQQGNTQYNPIIVTIPDVEDAVATSNGFSVGPVYNTYQSQENYYQDQLEFISNVTGTLWYYFTNDDKLPTAAAVKETVGNGGEGIIEANTMSVVKNTIVNLPLVFTSAPPAYMVVMLSDIDTDYQPMIVPTSGTGGSSSTTTGFFRAPTVSTAGSTPTLSYEANETGKLYYFFTNDSSTLNTMWDFFGDSTSRGYFSTSADGVKGVVDIAVGKGTVSLPTSRSVTSYSYVAIMMQSAAGMPGGYRKPLIIALNGSSSSGNSGSSGTIGFSELPYISGNTLYVTPNSNGTIYYAFSNSNSTDELYGPIYTLGGLGLGANMDAQSISKYLATSGNGASALVSYPGYRQSITLSASSMANYKYVAVWTVTTSSVMTSPVFVALSTYSGGTVGGTSATTNGFTATPTFYSWSNQIAFTPSVSGMVAYFFTNATTNYSTDQDFQNAYMQENTATNMMVSQGQSSVISANTNYKYVWIMLYTSTTYYIPVRVQIK